MQLFVTYVVVSSIFWSIFTFVAKYIISKKMKSYISFAYLQGLLLVTLYPILSFIIVPKEVFFPSLEVIPYAIISGGTSILAYLLMYYGLTKYDASTATPIIGVKAIFVIPMSYIFLGEFYGSSVILWILITMFGAIMTSWDKNTEIKRILSPRNKALWIFLTVAFLYAAGNVSVKPAMAMVSNFNFLIWREFAWFGVLLALMPFIFHKKEQKSLIEDWKGAIGIIIIGVLIQYFGYILLFYALGISVQITEGLMASTGLFAVIIGYLLSKTKSGFELESQSGRVYIIRMVGAILILIGIYKLSLVL